MPTFDLVVVGAGGGPDETNLSAYLLKPYDSQWQDGIIALEAGSAQGTLATLLQNNPSLFGSCDDTAYTAPAIFSFLKCYLITHAHLDHISGLILSAGSLGGTRKRIYAMKQTLQDIESVFSDRLWPNLASWDEADEDFKLLYSTLKPNNLYHTIYPNISVRTMAVNHGHNVSGDYSSAAFFIRHDTHNQEFVFFGDVEPDSLARKPKTFEVWQAAAPKIPKTLSAIFIECSWPSGRPDSTLYGHLNPEHLLAELTNLATEVVRFRKNQVVPTNGSRLLRPLRKRQKIAHVSEGDLQGALTGLTVYIMHCKDSLDPKKCLRDIIVKQVKTLVEQKGLGASIVGVEQGMRIEI